MNSVKALLASLLRPVFACVLLLGSLHAGHAATNYVTGIGDFGTNSLRSVISNSVSGDYIYFAGYLTGGTIALTNGEIYLDKNLTIDASALPAAIIISGIGTSRVFQVSAGVTNELHMLTITNGRAGSDGGAILNYGSLTLSRVTVAGNSTEGTNTFHGGGAIYNDQGVLTINQSTIASNSVAGPGLHGGAIYNHMGTVTLNQSTIANNVSGDRGGGVVNDNGTVTLYNTILAGNFAANGDSNILNGFVSTGTNLVDVDPQLSVLKNYGGATATMLPLVGSPAINGGDDAMSATYVYEQRRLPRLSGAHVDIGAVEFQSPAIVSSAADSGENTLRSAIVYGAPDTNITFSASLSGRSILLTNGELVLDKNLTIDASTLSFGLQLDGNKTSRIFNVSSGVTATLTALSLTNGAAGTNTGGAIFNSGTLTLKRCSFFGNTAKFAGALQNSGGCTIENCTFANNVAEENGGAIDNVASLLSITHSTFTANEAGGNGGAIDNYLNTLNITNSIIAKNTGASGADIYNWAASTVNCGGSNIVQSLVNGGTLNGNETIIVTDPRLAPLFYYGGPTFTYVPLPDSPAVDAAPATTLTNDQRGIIRPVDGDANGSAIADIGATEFQINHPLDGSYSGLFFITETASQETSGFGSMKVTTTGKLSAKFNVNGKKYSVSGAFNNRGIFIGTIKRSHTTPLTVTLYSVRNFQLYGTVTDGNWSSEIWADSAEFNPSYTTSLAGRYTMHIPGGDDAATSPHGDGYATVVLTSSGVITMKGVLADGTAIAQIGALSLNNQWPLFAPASTTKGYVYGWVNFARSNTKTLNGDIVWIRTANPKAKTYPAGFTNHTSVVGAQYTALPVGYRIINVPSPVATFDGGDFDLKTVTFDLDTKNKISNVSEPKFTLIFEPGTGLFSGKVTDPVTQKLIPFKGVVMQNEGAAYGSFVNANQGCSVKISAP